MKNKMAFSLIELMVVIAIVAILAAVAVPLYKQYTIKANLSNAVTHLKYWVDQASLYYNKNGVFPTNNQLGINNPTDPNGLLIPPNIPFIVVGPGSATGSQCQNATVNSYLINYDGATTIPIGSAQTGGPYLILGFNIIDVKGVIQSKCFYYEVDPVIMGFTYRNLINGCTNLALDPNAFNDAVQNTIDTGCL